MKRTFLLYALVAFYCLPFSVAAQERQYTIMETELIELERISESLAISKQNQQLQASSLAERLRAQEKQAKTLAVSLQEVEQKANVLRSQLQTERETLKALRQSYNEYEKEAAEQIAGQQAIINKQKDMLHRRMIAIIILSGLLIMIGLVTGMKYLLKYKFSLFHPP